MTKQDCFIFNAHPTSFEYEAFLDLRKQVIECLGPLTKKKYEDVPFNV